MRRRVWRRAFAGIAVVLAAAGCGSYADDLRALCDGTPAPAPTAMTSRKGRSLATQLRDDPVVAKARLKSEAARLGIVSCPRTDVGRKAAVVEGFSPLEAEREREQATCDAAKRDPACRRTRAALQSWPWGVAPPPGKEGSYWICLCDRCLAEGDCADGEGCAEPPPTCPRGEAQGLRCVSKSLLDAPRKDCPPPA